MTPSRARAVLVVALMVVAFAASASSARAACPELDGTLHVARGWDGSQATGLAVVSASPDAIVLTVAPSFTLRELCVEAEDGESLEAYFTVEPALPVEGPAQVVVASSGVPASPISAITVAGEPTVSWALPPPIAQAPLSAPVVQCVTIRGVSDRIRVGRPSRITVRVLGSGGRPIAGVRVTARGAGMTASDRTDGSGYAVLRFTPRRSGRITVRVAGSSTCILHFRVRGAGIPLLTG
jgi:hypothetical protein